MHHLRVDIGWPYVVLAVVMIVAAAPVVVAYWRFELRLARRVLRLPSRSHEGWPN